MPTVEEKAPSARSRRSRFRKDQVTAKGSSRSGAPKMTWPTTGRNTESGPTERTFASWPCSLSLVASREKVRDRPLGADVDRRGGAMRAKAGDRLIIKGHRAGEPAVNG
jgi:hypothetical protein